MKRILVTGASGFVGKSLIMELLHRKYSVRAALRKTSYALPPGINQFVLSDLNEQKECSRVLQGVEVVLHLAAQVPQRNMSAEVYQIVNRDLTFQMARACVSHGVKRLIFLSTLKVLGEQTAPNASFNLDSPPNPEDDYARSKWEAEQGLRQIANQTGLEVVIVRPPLVYGPGVKSNFWHLYRLIGLGLPIPFCNVNNQLSLVGLGNLVDLLCVCIIHPAAAGETFLVSDGEVVSTSELIRKIAHVQGRSPRLFPVPASWWKFLGKCTGRSAAVDRFVGSLKADISHTFNTLNWSPPFKMEEELMRLTQTSSVEYSTPWIRVLDIVFSSSGFLLSSPLLLLLYLLGLLDTGAPLFRQERLGLNQRPFVLIKFRTMKPETASIATHLTDSQAITPFGHFLRRTKLDELPQLWNVLKGEMSLVGPRPCLYNQKELIQERAKRGVFKVRPGITGLAQVQGIDMSTPKLLAQTDAELLTSLGLRTYLWYIILTVLGKGAGDQIST